MLRIANDPGMVMPVTVVIVIPIPLAGLDDAGGGERDQGEDEAAAYAPPPAVVEASKPRRMYVSTGRIAADSRSPLARPSLCESTATGARISSGCPRDCGLYQKSEAN